MRHRFLSGDTGEESISELEDRCEKKTQKAFAYKQREGKYKSLRDMVEYKIQHTHNESFRKKKRKMEAKKCSMI